jgi:hypothetical protein
MGLSAYQDNNQSPLDLNTLPTENAAEWEKLSKVDEVFSTMNEHYKAIGKKLIKIQKVRDHHGQSLIELSGAVEDGNNYKFRGETAFTPKGIMG